jgi:hypothetical protein
LPYARDTLQPGTPISGFGKNDAFVHSLAECDEVAVALGFTPLGDSLLFLSAVQACHEYFQLNRFDTPEWVLLEQHASLLRRCPILQRALIIGDLGALQRRVQDRNRVIVALTDIPSLNLPPPSFVFRKSRNAYPLYCDVVGRDHVVEFRAMPARYFLSFEMQVGCVLASNPLSGHPGFCFPPSITTEGAMPVRVRTWLSESQTRLCALIATTSLPEKKQFGVPRFLDVARCLQQHFSGANLAFVLVVSPSQVELEDPAAAMAVNHAIESLRLAVLATKDLDQLGYLFARCALVIGNDTGLSHLASLSSASPGGVLPEVLILYSRHDYTRWTSGRPNVRPIYTPFSDYLRRENLGIATDVVSDAMWGTSAMAASIHTKDVIDRASQILGERIGS